MSKFRESSLPCLTNMDTLLTDIKNFLMKLEDGQLDIEAGQWELHKDIANMKRTVEELKKLKQDVEMMRMSNAEQKGLIKNLEAKLEMINKHYQQEERPTLSESTVEYKTVYRRPIDEQVPPKGYKKRKCHRVRSEEIIEITSDLCHKKSESDELGSRREGSVIQETDEHEQTSDMSGRSSPVENIHAPQNQDIVKPRYQSHSNNNGILQRYLKDSAKYRDRKPSSSTEMSSSVTDQDHSMCGVATETTRCNIWDEYSSRVPRDETYPEGSPSQTYVSEEKRSMTNSAEETESVLPKRLVCQRNAKSNCKTDLPEHARRGQGSKYYYRFRARDKSYNNKDGVREYEVNHKDSLRNGKVYKCSYCEKVCSAPAKLAQHLKNCRIIVRSHFKRR